MQRRSFLQMSGGAAAGLMLPNARAATPTYSSTVFTSNAQYQQALPELFVPTPQAPSYSQAIVIGSGFGGAISALRLAQAGVQTTVLERGLRWPGPDPTREIFSNDFNPDGRAYWHRTSNILFDYIPVFMNYFGGIFDVTSYANINVWRGACVGGGSMVFTGCMIEPQQQYFEAIFGNTVDYNEMHQTYYPRVRKMLNLSTMPDDIYNSTAFSHSRIWDQQVRAAGYSPYLTNSIFNWNVVRQELAGTSRPSCIAGLSNMGNSNGAKFDLNQNYLKLAQATGNAIIYPGVQVLGISQDRSGDYLVSVKYMDPFGNTLSTATLACEYLFLGAGSVGTSELLVQAQALGELPNLNQYIGQGWGSNGDSAVIRSNSGATGAGNAQGTACRSGITDGTLGLPTTLENWYQLQVSFNLGICGSLGMVFDQTNRGHFTYNPLTKGVDLNWAANANNDAIAVTRQLNNKICTASGSSAGFPFTPDVNASFTAHPLGGAVIGKASDAYGRVDGYSKLYVMDGAGIPGSTGAVNPSLTISALAERNIENIIKAGQ